MNTVLSLIKDLNVKNTILSVTCAKAFLYVGGESILCDSMLFSLFVLRLDSQYTSISNVLVLHRLFLWTRCYHSSLGPLSWVDCFTGRCKKHRSRTVDSRTGLILQNLELIYRLIIDEINLTTTWKIIL